MTNTSTTNNTSKDNTVTTEVSRWADSGSGFYCCEKNMTASLKHEKRKEQSKTNKKQKENNKKTLQSPLAKEKIGRRIKMW